jgi:hypothetical protein
MPQERKHYQPTTAMIANPIKVLSDRHFVVLSEFSACVSESVVSDCTIGSEGISVKGVFDGGGNSEDRL